MNVVLAFRYAFLGAFVVCNAIICSSAGWSLGIVQSMGRSMDINGYLIFLGALALAFVVVTSVIELTRKDAFTTRVWFECLWVGVFFVLELCGAAVLTAVGSGLMCDVFATIRVSDACTSNRLTLAGSWACVMSLLLYLLVLGVSAWVHHREDPTVWQATVRDYSWDGTRSELPNSAPLPGCFSRHTLSIKAPQPRRLALPDIYAHRGSRISRGYDVERTQPPVPPVPVISPPRLMRQATREPVALPQPSLYPRHMELYTSGQPSRPIKGHRSSKTPPPLGSWPRANILNEPLPKKRREAPYVPRPPPNPSPRPSPDRVYIPTPVSRPTGPRTTPARSKNPSGDWRSRVVVPPPLDLSKISTSRPR